MTDEHMAIFEAVTGLAAAVEPGSEPGVEGLGRRLFDRLSVEGWLGVGLPEELGGAGGDAADAAAVIRGCVASGHLTATPDVLAVTGTLLSAARLAAPAGAQCILPIASEGAVEADGQVSVIAARVPWARWATHFVVVGSDDARSLVSIVAASAARVDRGSNVAGEPRDAVTLGNAVPVATAVVDRPAAGLIEQVRRAGALARSVQIAAAIRAALDLTLVYCRDRRQFGRPLAGFQAVQQELALLAGQAAAADAAVDLALDSVCATTGDLSLLPVAIAKVRTSAAAGVAAGIAHQLHGAIGITTEYRLHRFARPLWAWRGEYGPEVVWARDLAVALEAPHDGLEAWARLSGSVDAATGGE